MNKPSWLTHGVRVGESLRYEGERLRELGLEPDPKPVPPVVMAVTEVTASTITVHAFRK